MGKAPYEQFAAVERLQPATPLDAVLTVGRRNANGQPADRDRFFIMAPELKKKTFTSAKDKTFQADARDPHPEFHDWNRRAGAGRIAKSRHGQRDLAVMRGLVAFPSIKASFQSQFWAKSLEGEPKPPGRFPACTGNGVQASRFARMDGTKPVYKTIECPEDCPFLHMETTDSCKIRAALTFFPNWGADSPLPRRLMQWRTRSEQSAENALGMLHTARDLGIGMGIPDPSLIALPFEMRITTHTSSIKRASFPIVEFAIMTDIPAFFMAQKEQQAQLAAGPGYVTATLTPGSDALLLEAGDEEYPEDPALPRSRADQTVSDLMDWRPSPEEQQEIDAKEGQP
jgi:hypothetical protein